MNQTFFRLTHHDWVECFTKLSRSELGVLFYLRTLNPFGDRRLKINCQAIGEVLDIHRTSVSRALKKLEQMNLIELEITSAQVKLKTSNRDAEPDPSNDANQVIDKVSDTIVHPRTECASTHNSVHPRTECASTHKNRASTHGSVHPRTIGIPEPLPDKDPRTPQTLKTYIDFKKTLSEGERENFFNFVKEKTNNLERPINDLEAWLASKNAAKQNRWEIYYRNYQEEKINQSAGTNKQNPGLENYSPSKLQNVILRFQNRRRINKPEPENEPKEVEREEIKRQQAEINRLMDNPPEYEVRKSAAQQQQEAMAEIRRQQEANRKAAEKRARQEQQFNLEERQAEIQRQIEAFNRIQNIGKINGEIDEIDEIDKEGKDDE